MQPLAVARNAMATRFEVVLHGDNPVRLRAAAEEALDEIDRLDAALSFHLPSSQIAQVNARAARAPVPVSAEVFALLQRCGQLTAETGGAFDITLAPLLRCWKFIGATGATPTDADIAAALDCTGWRHVELDEAASTVRFRRSGVQLDLGAIGKGYALEIAAQRLRELGMSHALIHGGTSTACAFGVQPDGRPWRIAIEHPDSTAAVPLPPLSVVDLLDGSLSVSGVKGKSFIDIEGRTQGHVIDPRTGRPTQAAQLAAVWLPDATESDAFSTALLVDGPVALPRLCAVRPNIRALAASIQHQKWNINSVGL